MVIKCNTYVSALIKLLIQPRAIGLFAIFLNTKIFRFSLMIQQLA